MLICYALLLKPMIIWMQNLSHIFRSHWDDLDPVVQIGKVLNLDVGMEKHDCPRAHFHFRRSRTLTLVLKSVHILVCEISQRGNLPRAITPGWYSLDSKRNGSSGKVCTNQFYCVGLNGPICRYSRGEGKEDMQKFYACLYDLLMCDVACGKKASSLFCTHLFVCYPCSSRVTSRSHLLIS